VVTSANSEVRDEKGAWLVGTAYTGSIQWNADPAGVPDAFLD
jgi:hypothetical protein